MMRPMRPGLSGEITWEFMASLAVLLIVGLVAVAVLTLRRRRRQRDAEQGLLQRTRAVVRQQLDAVADDILELEGMVWVASNDQALAHYRHAASAYAVISGEFELAKTVQDLTALAAQLDTAISQLDTAKAILGRSPTPLEPRATSMSPSQRTHLAPQREKRRSALYTT